jgi:hypothetical protein
VIHVAATISAKGSHVPEGLANIAKLRSVSSATTSTSSAGIRDDGNLLLRKEYCCSVTGPQGRMPRGGLMHGLAENEA